MKVVVTRVEVYLNCCSSLKEKRSIIEKVITRLRKKFNLSVSEVDYQEKWQRSVIGLACVGTNLRVLERVIESALELIESNIEGEIINVEKDLY